MIKLYLIEITTTYCTSGGSSYWKWDGSHNLGRYRGMTTSFHVKTEVLFGEHKPDIIDWYLSTGEYKDKAGGYGTQAIGAFLIKEIRGCYYNVMGLPIHRLIEEIMKLTSKDD